MNNAEPVQSAAGDSEAPAGASPAPQPPNAKDAAGGDKSAISPFYQLAEEGWEELVKAAAKVQKAANAIKKTERSVDGYNIERTLNKHKPHLMAEHLAGLREHRKTNEL